MTDPPRTTAVTNARLRGRQGLWTVTIAADGIIASIAEATSAGEPVQPDAVDAAAVDADGGLVIPAFIDSHLHLDLAYSLDLVAPNTSGTLAEAIRHWADAKRELSSENVRQRARRAIDDEIAFGVGFIRTHVDVGTAAGLRLCHGVLAARDETRGRIDIQVVAFPQDGLLSDPGAVDQMGEAMRMGCDLIGGIAHYERTDADRRQHIKMIFDLAEAFDADIDCHIDETDDPDSRCTEVLAAHAIERGWQGRVTASHVCALASYDDAHAARVIALLAEGGVHVVTNPGVNLHLQGRQDRYPKRRGLTRVSELMDAGVNVSAGQDCIKDPFYPMGTGNMLEVGHLLIHADHLSTPGDIERVADCITDNPSKALRLADYGLAVGKRANLVVLEAADVAEAFRTRRAPVCRIRNGCVLGC